MVNSHVDSVLDPYMFFTDPDPKFFVLQYGSRFLSNKDPDPSIEHIFLMAITKILGNIFFNPKGYFI